MNEAAATTPLPRRGRIWVILALSIATIAIGYAIVNIALKKPGGAIVRVGGIDSAQEIFGGVPQEGDRLGSEDAPVSIQVFIDLQCGNCVDQFVGTIPPLVTNYARPGDVKLLLRHYSIAENPLEAGFFGAEAAAAQGYGWQYTYLFFRNQDEAAKFQIDEEFMASLAGSIGELEIGEWEEDLKRERSADGPVKKTLEGYEELGTELGIRTEPADIVTGPEGTRTLQDGPTLAQIEHAIAAVGG